MIVQKFNFLTIFAVYLNEKSYHVAQKAKSQKRLAMVAILNTGKKTVLV